MSHIPFHRILPRATWRDERARPSPAQPATPLGSAAEPAVVVREVAALESDWDDLRKRAGGVTFFQSVAWCAAWIAACEAAGHAEDVRIVTVRDGGRLVLLWPLAVRRVGPIAVLHALAEPATQYCDALVEASPRSSAWLDSAWRAVLAQRDVDLVHLRKVRADGALERFGPQWLDGRARATDAAPFLRMAANDEAARLRRSGRSVNALRRHLKRLGEHGPVAFEVVPAERHVAALEEALRLKRDWSAGRGAASAGYSHPANEAAMLALARQGSFTVRRLRVGEETAAVEIGVVDRGHYLSMIQSYDARFAHHAPGRLLFWRMFDERGTGIDTFDFLAPLAPHKTEWTDQSVVVTDYAIVRSLNGRLYVELSRILKPRLKRLHRTARRLARLRVSDAIAACRGFGKRRSSSHRPAPDRVTGESPGKGNGP